MVLLCEKPKRHEGFRRGKMQEMRQLGSHHLKILQQNLELKLEAFAATVRCAMLRASFALHAAELSSFHMPPMRACATEPHMGSKAAGNQHLAK
eukprot:5310560-Amphidinium_carterae.1